MRSFVKTTFTLLALASLSVSLAGCAGSPRSGLKTKGSPTINDPLEPVNRVTHGFNEVVDTVLLTPLNTVYRFIMPDFGRKAVHNVIENVKSPVYLANNLLQGDLTGAGNTVKRFAVNSTAGLGGLIDVASNMDIPAKPEDFGQTLATWGVGSGPYVVLPILGPSSLRDTVGMGVDNLALDPLNVWARNTDRDGILIGRAVATAIDTKEQYRDAQDILRRDSADYYAALRSVYAQRRFALINNGEAAAAEPEANDIP